jgi:hypothetical protein
MKSETSLGKNCPRCGAPLPADAPAGHCPQCLLRQGLEETTVNPDGGSSGRFTPPAPEVLARQLPHLEIMELIGRGGMGAVYKGRQPVLDRLVAVKILPPQVGHGPEFAERFTREARTLARLSHPNIVAIYDFGRTQDPAGEGFYYFVMEYVGGTNLRELFTAGRLEPKAALSIVPQICDALQYAHDEGIVHRDIKPENILIDPLGRVRITDFGLAKLMDRPSAGETRLTRDGDVMGTPHYMAPEQIERARDVDHRADIYSLGVVFYEMLTGELPVGRFSPPSRRVAVDLRFDEIVLRSLEKEPERRYQHASDVKTEVEIIRNRPAGGVLEAPARVERPAASREGALAQVKAPAICLIAIGIFNWVVVSLMFSVPVLFNVLPAFARNQPLTPGVVVPVVLLIFLLSVLMMYGGLKMLHGESRGLALVAGTLAMVVTPGNLFGLFVGIWVWVVLHREEVRKAFTASRSA